MKKLHLELDDIRVETFKVANGDDHGEGTVEGQQAGGYRTCGSPTCDDYPCPWTIITGYCHCIT